jgi:hypothetical protein
MMEHNEQAANVAKGRPRFTGIHNQERKPMVSYRFLHVPRHTESESRFKLVHRPQAGHMSALVFCDMV